MLASQHQSLPISSLIAVFIPSGRKIRRHSPTKMSIIRSIVVCFGLVLLIVASSIDPVSANFADFLNEIDASGGTPIRPVVADPLKDVFEDNGISPPCHVEYQVTKRAVGRCVKLGRDGHGCVYGNYLDPFHPECM